MQPYCGSADIILLNVENVENIILLLASTFEAMRFGSADPLNTSIDAVFRPSINEFRGNSTLQLVLDYVA